MSEDGAARAVVSAELTELEARTLIDPKRGLDEDRRFELIEFFGSAVDLSIEPSNYESDLSALDDARLFDHLESTARNGLVRNLLKSVRLREAAGLVGVFRELFAGRDPSTVRILDFGCGSSDHGLALALAGFQVAIADIPSKVGFASWRYKKRGLPVEAIEITPGNWKRPPIGRRDAIVCGEVLEHLRYPLETTRAFRDALAPGRFLWVSAYPFREKRRGGTHLEEAWKDRPAVLQEMKRDYRRLRREDMNGYLLERRGPGVLARLFGSRRTPA